MFFSKPSVSVIDFFCATVKSEAVRTQGWVFPRAAETDYLHSTELCRTCDLWPRSRCRSWLSSCPSWAGSNRSCQLLAEDGKRKPPSLSISASGGVFKLRSHKTWLKSFLHKKPLHANLHRGGAPDRTGRGIFCTCTRINRRRFFLSRTETSKSIKSFLHLLVLPLSGTPGCLRCVWVGLARLHRRLLVYLVYLKQTNKKQIPGGGHLRFNQLEWVSHHLMPSSCCWSVCLFVCVSAAPPSLCSGPSLSLADAPFYRSCGNNNNKRRRNTAGPHQDEILNWENLPPEGLRQPGRRIKMSNCDPRRNFDASRCLHHLRQPVAAPTCISCSSFHTSSSVTFCSFRIKGCLADNTIQVNRSDVKNVHIYILTKHRK